jgi:hypothetical protein
MPKPFCVESRVFHTGAVSTLCWAVCVQTNARRRFPPGIAGGRTSGPHDRAGTIDNRRGSSRRFLAVGLQTLVDQGDNGVDLRIAHALLPADELNQLVGALYVLRAVL